VDALRADGRAIWVTDLSSTALSLDAHLEIPRKMAIVIGMRLFIEWVLHLFCFSLLSILYIFFLCCRFISRGCSVR
jgi:hypothetical protein